MLTFKQFDTNSVQTKQGNYYLGETISHIEDLDPQDFLHAVKNIAYLIASEKLDGANLIVGFNMDGSLYTSRETKGGKRQYTVISPTRAADNGFCAAHKALDEVKATLKEVLSPGEAVECEILFGRQPNAIVYGSNYIAFLRMVPGDNHQEPDQSKVKKLNEALKGKTVSIELSMISTIDGSELIRKDETVTFKFTSAATIDNFEFHKVDLKKELDDFEQWLKTNPPNNFKTKKAFVEAASKFMLPIKEKLLDNIVRKLKPSLRDADVEPHEDFGVEGIVVLDPKTGKQFKIIDKSIFTVINQFNHAIRNEIRQTIRFNKEAYAHLFKHFDASTNTNGSIYDSMLARIAAAIGISGLSQYMNITRTINKYESPEAFIKAWPQDVNKLRPQIVHAIEEALRNLEQSRKYFLDNWKNFRLTLNSGKEIKYSEEIYKRTLIAYAEAQKELTEMRQKTQNANAIAELANALFGKQLKAIR